MSLEAIQTLLDELAITYQSISISMLKCGHNEFNVQIEYY